MCEGGAAGAGAPSEGRKPVDAPAASWKVGPLAAGHQVAAEEEEYAIVVVGAATWRCTAACSAHGGGGNPPSQPGGAHAPATALRSWNRGTAQQLDVGTSVVAAAVSVVISCRSLAALLLLGLQMA